jgi:serine/threonine-protein kinase
LAAWTVPGYTETGVLGTGGTGRVVEAVHDASGTRVAIKYLSARLCADESFRERFRAEATRLTGLEHPNVVRFRALVETDLDLALVMELVDGSSLCAVLASAGPLPPEAALVVLRGSLLGLAAVDELDIVHRDYKPSNVLITPEGVSKLVDVGIATRTEAMMPAAGTPSYMAPELWEGAPAEWTNDLYAITAVLYECLTGRVPYSAESVFELQTMHRAAPVPVDDVPEALRPLVSLGLAKDPEERPADAAAFLDELEVFAVLGYGLKWEERGRRDLVARVLPLPEKAGPAEGQTALLPVPAPREDDTAAMTDVGGGEDPFDGAGAWGSPTDEREGMGRGTKTGLAAAAVAVVGAVVAAVAFTPGKPARAASGTSGEIVAAPSGTASPPDGGAPGVAAGGTTMSGSSSSAPSSSPAKPASTSSTRATTATTASGTSITMDTPASLPLATLSSLVLPSTTPTGPTPPPSTTKPTTPASSATTPTTSSTVTIEAAATLANGTYDGVCPPATAPTVTVVFSVGGLPQDGTTTISYHWHVAGSGAVGNGGGGVGGAQTVAAKNGRNQVQFTVDIPQGRKALSGQVQVTWSASGQSGSATTTAPVNITCTN